MLEYIGGYGTIIEGFCKPRNNTSGWLNFIRKRRSMQFLSRAANLKVVMVLMMAFLFIPIIYPVSVKAERFSGNPWDVAVDSMGNIYVLYDADNESCC
jgi:hypothetical protein